MVSNTRLTLNLQYPNIAQVAYAMQGDRLSRAVVADLIDGSTPWAPPAGAYGLITASKPDGTFAVYDTLEDGSPAIVIDGSTVTLYLAEQVLADAGAVKMSVAFFTSAGARLTTFRWTEVVAPEAVLDRVVSGNYISILTATLAQAADDLEEAQTIFDQIKQVYGAPWTAATAADMTDTSRVYVYTGTTGGGFTNGHWYYWNGTAWTDGGNYNSTGFTTDTTLSIAGAAADAAATGAVKGKVEAMNPYDTIELGFVSGGINSNGGLPSASNTRIRTLSNAGHSVVAQGGDKIYVSGVYIVSAFAYNTRAITSSNLYRRFAVGVNGSIDIPPDCVGKYIAVSITKVGHESDDISGDLETIQNDVKYYRVEPVVVVSKIDPTLTKQGYVAESKATGDAIESARKKAIDQSAAILPELDSFRFDWEIGKTVAASGTILENSSYALSEIIPVNEGNILENANPDTGEDSQITVLMVALYNNGVFVPNSRVTISYGDRYIIPSGADGIRIAYGYTSANPSPKVMTRQRLDNYFGIRFLNEAQPVNYIGDGEHPVYVAFGASTTEGDVHHYSGEDITVSEYNYPDYIGKVLNLKTYNLGVGSTGFMKRGDSGSASYGTKPNIMDQIYANDSILSQAKLITIMFGYGNDNWVGANPAKYFSIGNYTDYYPYDEEGYHPGGVEGMNTMISKGATLMGCLNWCVKWISEKYPYAQLIIIFGSPSANDARNITMTAQTEGQGIAPYTLTFNKDPYKDAEDHYGSEYGIYLINEELKKLKEAMDIPIVNLFYEGNAFNWYSTYAKKPDNANEYALFSTKGTQENPTWNSHPNDLGYKYYARFVAGKVTSLFRH